MRKSIFPIIVVSFMLALIASPAYADKCKDPVVDEINVLDDGSRAKLQNSMRALTSAGADIRVMFLSSYHRDANGNMHKNLAGYKDTMLAKCRSWQAADGGLKNNLILFIVVPQKKTSAVYYGKQWTPMLGPYESRYNSDMTAKFRDGDLVGGMLIGLTDAADLISIKPSQQNKPVVINHPSDYSGLWTVFKWIVALGALGLLIWLAFRIFGQFEKRRGAQRDAVTERGKCSQALNAIGGELDILKNKISRSTFPAAWMRVLNEMLERADRKYTEAVFEFDTLNRSSNNPNTKGLSPAEYYSMKERYSKVSALFAEAQKLLEDLQEEYDRALRGEEPRLRNASVAHAKPDITDARSTTEKDSRISKKSTVKGGPKPPEDKTTAPKEVHHHHHHDRPVVIRESSDVVVVPVLVGERDRVEPPREDRWADERRTNPNNPVIVEEPSKEGGKEVDFGSSGRGEGTAQAWGSSGSGRGEERSWDTTKPSSSASDDSSDRSRTGY